jgi:hypothetical protein
VEYTALHSIPASVDVLTGNWSFAFSPTAFVVVGLCFMMCAPIIDHDQLFKRLLREFFREFATLFLPSVDSYLDPTSIEFLDKELFTEKQPGDKRNADLVAKARFRGVTAYFLIHIEPESSRRRKRGAFAWRMFDYFALLTRNHRLPVYPVALLSYDTPRNLEADSWRVAFPDKTILEFHFTVIQLNRLKWRDYLRQDNPVAAALMAKMGFASEERVEVKKECLRMIARLRYEPEKTKFLAGFVDTYLRLNAEEHKQFVAALKNMPREERKTTMEIMTSWEEMGWNRGIQQGEQIGLQKGERAIVLRQLARRVGVLSKRAQTSIARLSIEQVESLSEALLDFTHPRDLTRWLREHAATNGTTNGKRTKK